MYVDGKSSFNSLDMYSVAGGERDIRLAFATSFGILLDNPFQFSCYYNQGTVPYFTNTFFE